MKTLSSFSKTIFTAAIVLSALVFMSCKKDAGTSSSPVPAEDLTTYTGTLTYTSSTGSTIANATTGKATIVKDGSKYKITFSDSVPALEGLKFEKEDGEYVTITEDGSVAGIVIEDGDLDIGVTSGGNTWAFSGSR